MSTAQGVGESRSGRPVRVDREDGLAVVTFDSPPLNLFDAAMSDALDAVVAQLEADRPRAVLFRAEGRVVSGGVAVSLFAALAGPRAAEGVFAGLVAVARRVDRLPCPTVFAAHGLCLTWAFELALACDIILASESAAFGLVEKVIGLTPAMGGTQRLAERAGTGRAREFVMAGRPVARTPASSRRGPPWRTPRPSRCSVITSTGASNWPMNGSPRWRARCLTRRISRPRCAHFWTKARAAQPSTGAA